MRDRLSRRIVQIEPSIANASDFPSGDHAGHHGVLLPAGGK